MPTLDVSEILTDTDICDTFDVVRRVDAVSAAGRSTIATTTIPCQVGVVIIVDPGDNARRDDGQMTSRVIDVVTKFRLRAAGEGIQPDVIRWAGVDYTVKSIKPHGRFGMGFVKATAESMNAADPPPV